MILLLGFLMGSGVLHSMVLCDDLKKGTTTTELPSGTMTTLMQNSVIVPTTPASTNTTEQISSTKTNSLNSFASGLNKYIFSSNEKDSPQPVIWSPLSVYAALLAIYKGADGSTLQEMKNIMSIKDDNEMLANLTQISPNSLLKSFTGLFFDEGVSLNPSYEDQVASSTSNKDLGMSTKIQPMNFKNTTMSAQLINEIIKNKTDGQIGRIIDETGLSATTKMVIINAVRFKGKWKNPFDAKVTKSDVFHGLKASTAVNMMKQKGTFEFSELAELNASVLQMEYADSSFVCQFILPNTNNSVQSVWKAINEKGVIDELSNYMVFREMEVYIPKMRIESDVPIQEALVKMGLSILFTPQANLSRMLKPTKDSYNDVFVSKMMHKTVLEMDEKGTKAAAATAGVLIPLSNFNSQPEIFRVDRPFVIILRDIKTNSIAFMGCVTELTPGDTDFSESDRANIIPTPESPNQIEDPDTENSKISEDEGTHPPQSTTAAASSTTEEEWWKHTGAPEYLSIQDPENSILESKAPNTTMMTLATPRFQQPEPNNPSAIRFPYPYTATYELNTGSPMKKSKEKNKFQSLV